MSLKTKTLRNWLAGLILIYFVLAISAYIIPVATPYIAIIVIVYMLYILFWVLKA